MIAGMRCPSRATKMSGPSPPISVASDASAKASKPSATPSTMKRPARPLGMPMGSMRLMGSGSSLKFQLPAKCQDPEEYVGALAFRDRPLAGDPGQKLGVGNVEKSLILFDFDLGQVADLG